TLASPNAPTGFPGRLNAILMASLKTRRTSSSDDTTAHAISPGWRFRCLPAPATAPPALARRHAGCRSPLPIDLAIHGQPYAGLLPLRLGTCAPSDHRGGSVPSRKEEAASTRRFVLVPPPAPLGGTEGVKEKGIAGGNRPRWSRRRPIPPSRNTMMKF